MAAKKTLYVRLLSIAYCCVLLRLPSLPLRGEISANPRLCCNICCWYLQLLHQPPFCRVPRHRRKLTLFLLCAFSAFHVRRLAIPLWLHCSHFFSCCLRQTASSAIAALGRKRFAYFPLCGQDALRLRWYACSFEAAIPGCFLPPPSCKQLASFVRCRRSLFASIEGPLFLALRCQQPVTCAAFPRANRRIGCLLLLCATSYRPYALDAVFRSQLLLLNENLLHRSAALGGCDIFPRRPVLRWPLMLCYCVRLADTGPSLSPGAACSALASCS